MRKFQKCKIVFITFVSLLVVISISYAQESKFAYVNGARLLSSSNETEIAKQKLQKEVADWQKEADDLRNEIAVLEKDFQNQALLLSNEKKREKEEIITRKKIALDEYLGRYFSADGKAVQREAELIKPIEERILGIIKKISLEQGYTMVFDATNSGMLYARPELDITDKVIEELKKVEASMKIGGESK